MRLKVQLKDDGTGVLCPPSLSQLAMWAGEPYKSARCKTINYDVKAKTCIVEVTAEPPSWLDALKRNIGGKGG